MIKSITITNHLGESITMELTSPEKSGFVVRFIDGLGPPKANIEMTEMSLMDGALYNSARAQSRNIVISLSFLLSHVIYLDPIPSPPKNSIDEVESGTPIGLLLALTHNIIESFSDNSENIVDTDSQIVSTIEDTRQKSYKYFPLKRRVKILIETDNRFCETYGYVESNISDIFSKEEGCIISILCPNSYLLSPEIHVTIFATIEPAFEFPFSNESTTLKLLEFSTIQGYFTKTVNYPGDADVGMVMYMHVIGDVENIEIFKLEPEPVESIQIDTNRIEALTGAGLHVGDDVIISTVKGNKYAILVRDGVETNILNCLDKFTDWIQLTRGDNIFTYTAEVGILNLQFRIENQVAYEGI